MKTKTTNDDDSKLIDELGGTGAVARIFEISDPTVSIWRKTGIPKARRMYLKLAYPHLFIVKQPIDTGSLSNVSQS